MPSLDKVSKMLGGLQSDMKHVRKTSETILEKTDKLNETVIIQGQRIKSAHERIDDIEPKVNEHEAIKNQGVGFWIALTTISGSVAGCIGAFITKAFF